MDRLPVRRHDHQHHRGDQQTDLPREGEGRHAYERQGEQNLVRGVRDAGQRVGCEHGQCDPLRQESLTKLMTGQLPPDEEAFGRFSEIHAAENTACVGREGLAPLAWSPFTVVRLRRFACIT